MARKNDGERRNNVIAQSSRVTAVSDLTRVEDYLEVVFTEVKSSEMV